MKQHPGWIEQQIQALLTVRGHTDAISKAEEIKLSKVLNELTKIVHRYCMFVDFMKRNLNFAISFEKTYMEKFVASRTLNVKKDVMVSDLLTGMNSKPCYKYIYVAKVILKQDAIISSRGHSEW